MNTFFLLCLEYFKTGLFAVGGGLATLPFLKEISAKYGWFTTADLATMIAVSESTPGPIGVNMATYVGTKMFGFPGAVAATFSLVLPSVVIVILISRALAQFQNSEIVQGAFTGLRPAVVGFILAACVDIFLTTLLHTDAVGQLSGLTLSAKITAFVNVPSVLLFAVLLAVYLRFPKLHPAILILAGAAAGILFKM